MPVMLGEGEGFSVEWTYRVPGRPLPDRVQLTRSGSWYLTPDGRAIPAGAGGLIETGWEVAYDESGALLGVLILRPVVEPPFMGATIYPSEVRDAVDEDAGRPALAWVEANIAIVEDPLSGIGTAGLAAHGLPEVGVFLSPHLQFLREDVARWLKAVAAYMVIVGEAPPLNQPLRLNNQPLIQLVQGEGCLVLAPWTEPAVDPDEDSKEAP